MHIVKGGLEDPRVVELLQTHLTRARARPRGGARTRSTSPASASPR